MERERSEQIHLSRPPNLGDKDQQPQKMGPAKKASHKNIFWFKITNSES